MVMKYCSDKNNFVVANNKISGHRSQRNAVNSTENSDFSVESFWPKDSTKRRSTGIILLRSPKSFFRFIEATEDVSTPLFPFEENQLFS